MKTRRFEAGGNQFRLAPLTFGQAEALAAEPDPWAAILWSLANAGAPAEQAQLKQQLDLHDLDALYRAVLEESGLTLGDGSGEPTHFDELRATLITALGWTSRECEEQPFPHVCDLFTHWTKQPPAPDALTMMLGAFTNWRRGAGMLRGENSSKDEIAQAVTSYGGRLQGFDCLPAEIQQLLDRDLHIFQKPDEPEIPKAHD